LSLASYKKLRQLVLLTASKHLGVLQQAPGEVLMSGLDTLKRGDFYVMGLNPATLGSEKAATPITVIQHLEKWNELEFSAYRDQCWRDECWQKDSFGRQIRAGCPHHDSKKKTHQRVVTELLGYLGVSPFNLHTIFTTNAIFAASRNANSFLAYRESTLDDAWKSCWPVHQLLLRIVRPKVILCLGYGNSSSSFAYLRGVGQQPVEAVVLGKGVKYFDAVLPVTVRRTLSCRVVGVFHPSWGNRVKKTREEFRNIVEEKVRLGPMIES
jgi:hypothetical protein